MKTMAMVSVSLLGLAVASGAAAQTGQSPPGASAEEPAQAGVADIIVTATRQATSLQETPIAITAITSGMLEERGLKSVADLTATVPNAQFRRAQGAYGPGVTAFIRGIGQFDTSLGSEPAVAYYIDDIYYPILLGSNFDLLDLDRVEVLRGPQGTLFGRNSLAGAVNIVSKQPDTKDASAYVEVTMGSYDRLDVRAGFNVPLSEKAAIMIAAVSKKRTGYVRRLDFVCEMNRRGTPGLIGNVPTWDPLNTTTPNYKADDCTIGHLGGEEVRAVRGSLLWEPTSDVRLTLAADHTRDTSENPADVMITIDPSRANANIRNTFAAYGVAYDSRFLTGSPFSTYETFADPTRAGTVIPGNAYYNGLPTRGGYKLDPYGHLTNWGVSGKLVWGVLDDIDLTVVLGYRRMDETHSYAQDHTPLITEHTLSNISEEYKTAEVRLSGSSKLVDWVVGGFYFDALGRNHASTISPRNSVQRTQNTTYEPTSKAVFANATIRPFGDWLGVVLGGRYSDDVKVVKFSNLVDTTPSSADIVFNVKPKDSRFSWKAGLNVQATDTMMIYASAATGYSLPGFNPRPLQPSQVTQFDGNDNIAYELGAKLDLFDRRLRLNGAVFYTDFRTRPVTVTGQEVLLTNGAATPGNSVTIPLPGGPAGSTTCRARTPAEVAGGVAGFTCIGRTYYQNTPAKVKGFELEATINPVEPLLINAAVGYTRFTSPDLLTRVANRRQQQPRWQLNAGIQYRFDIDAIGGDITPRLDWSYQGLMTSNSVLTSAFNQPGYSMFNARLTYNNLDHEFEVAAGATNLFNKFYYHNFFVYQDFGDSQVNGQPGAPRQLFISVTKKF